MALTFDPADFEKMKRIENEIANVLLRAKTEHVEAAIVAFACIRCARLLLDQYRESVRTELAHVATAFLRRDKVTVEGEGNLIGVDKLRLM